MYLYASIHPYQTTYKKYMKVKLLTKKSYIFPVYGLNHVTVWYVPTSLYSVGTIYRGKTRAILRLGLASLQARLELANVRAISCEQNLYLGILLKQICNHAEYYLTFIPAI